MKLELKGNAGEWRKQLVLPVSAITLAIVSWVAGSYAFHYRFSDPHMAKACDAVTYGGMAILFVLIAKINLTRTPRHENLALFAAGAAGLMVSAVIDNVISLFAK